MILIVAILLLAVAVIGETVSYLRWRRRRVMEQDAVRRAIARLVREGGE